VAGRLNVMTALASSNRPACLRPAWRRAVGVLAGAALPVLGCTAAIAADVAFERWAEPQRPGFLSELRFGYSAQDPWGRETGSSSLAGEILFRRPLTPADLFTSYFVPRPHLGTSANLGGRTSFAYTGLTWTVDIGPRLFIEGSLGAAVHNGYTSRPFATPPDRAALGCSPLFRESGAVGVRLSTNWSVLATVERLSNGGLCADNKGLTNVGARLGYSF
jgi:lipid A 3-O-deacylase